MVADIRKILYGGLDVHPKKIAVVVTEGGKCREVGSLGMIPKRLRAIRKLEGGNSGKGATARSMSGKTLDCPINFAKDWELGDRLGVAPWTSCLYSSHRSRIGCRKSTWRD